jgi:inhibitor of KinA sporulation pathway (predicted exonuclease)
MIENFRDQNYLALDLELNNKNDGTVPRIISVGVAIGSPVRPDDMVTQTWYLDPEEAITPFISGLTGITDEIIQEKSVSHETAAKELGELIHDYQCFTNPVTWGQGDSEELKSEFRERGVGFPFFGRRIIDVKTIYVFQQMVTGRTPSGGLRKSMISFGLNFLGKAHRAEDDALNTLRFLFHLMKRQRNYEDLRDKMREMK